MDRVERVFCCFCHDHRRYNDTSNVLEGHNLLIVLGRSPRSKITRRVYICDECVLRRAQALSGHKEHAQVPMW